MRNYWSCTKFADWVRGTAKPPSATSKGWAEWRKTAKTSHVFRYWLAEEGLDGIQNIILYIPDRIHDVKYYINNRWITHTHALTAHPRDISPGGWCDVGNRFLFCLFNELQNFVEVELAWWHLAWNSSEERSKYNMPWWAHGWWRVRTWRCPQAGLDNLDWQSKLIKNEDYGLNPGDEHYGDPTDQAIGAQEILDLYNWWTIIRPQRPDPMDASGWTAYCEKRREKGGSDLSILDYDDETEEERKECRRAMEVSHQMEEAYDAEDEQMLIRLIKIRKALWT
jgi:hypothetical protein